MSLVWRPGFNYDTDASAYIDAVEVADGQALETATRYAINNFVIGCKSDGIWSAIKASCILAGARTLNGALVPLVGSAPTNVGNYFVSGDYSRKTGLKANGTTKYLSSGRSLNSDPQNNHHMSAYITATNTISAGIPIGGVSGTDYSEIVCSGTTGTAFRSRRVTDSGDYTSSLGFNGFSRNAEDRFDFRLGLTTRTATARVSVTPGSASVNVFARSDGSVKTNARLAFYSIGESLDLALLDARVTALITAFGAAIP